MSELGTLHQRLHSLVHGAAPRSGGARQVLFGEETDVAKVLCREIAEIQLLRCATFCNDRNEELTFDISSGRVLRLGQPTSAAILSEDIDVPAFQQALNVEMLADVLGILSRFTQDVASLNVTTRLSDTSAPTLVTGLSAEVLLAGLERSAAGSVDLAAVLDASSAQADAGVMIASSDLVHAYGEQEDIAQLMQIAQSGSDTAGVVKQAQDHGCVIYGGHPSTGKAVLCASNGDEVVMVLFEPDKLDAIVRMWHAHLA